MSSTIVATVLLPDTLIASMQETQPAGLLKAGERRICDYFNVQPDAITPYLHPENGVSPKKTEKILKLISQGESVKAACEHCNVAETTFYGWVRSAGVEKEYREAFKQGEPLRFQSEGERTAKRLRSKRHVRWKRAVREGKFQGTWEQWCAKECGITKMFQARNKIEPVKIIPLKETAEQKAERQAQQKERTRIKNRDRHRERYRTDPEFRLKEILRCQARKHQRFGCLNTRIREGLKSQGRNGHVFDMLGYSAEELKRHLEKQFAKGMSWDAFLNGEIHIDHVMPLRSFDLEDEEQVKQAWALPNLQPLWARDNSAKAAKIQYLL